MGPLQSEPWLHPQILNMDICPQPDVVGQIPPDVVRVIVDHDVIAIPEPVIAIVVVIRRDREKETAETEPRRTAAAQPPNVSRANWACEMAVLPGMVEMIVRIVASGVVANPLVILRVNVRSLRMALLIIEGAPLIVGGSRRTRRSADRSRPMCRNAAAANAMLRISGMPTA